LPLWKYPVHFIAFGFGTGLLPGASGTFGTLPGVVLYRVMASLSPLRYWAITSLLWLIGIPICEQTAADLGAHDPGAIVWDEIVGFLVAMFRLPRDWGWLAAGFVVYRLFDVWKPYPIGYVEESLGAGFSIMADDVVAGAYAWVVLHLVHRAVRL
jgi:phosphatidylglycerophosphatase A